MAVTTEHKEGDGYKPPISVCVSILYVGVAGQSHKTETASGDIKMNPGQESKLSRSEAGIKKISK